MLIVGSAPKIMVKSCGQLTNDADDALADNCRRVAGPPRPNLGAYRLFARFFGCTAFRSKNSAWLTRAETVDCW